MNREKFEMKRTMRGLCKAGAIALSAIFLATAFSAAAHASNLAANGGFESTTNGNGQLGFNTNATSWSTNGYNFIYAPGTADTSGANGQFGNVALWGPGNGSPNGLTTSPDGGNFVALDGNFEVGTLNQTITGLTIGDSYTVSFYWAGAQQAGFDGPTTDQLTVSLGGASQSTAVVPVANHGFTGWMQESFTFTADGTSDLLSFLATSTPPNGEPPFALLDGVVVAPAVPEPATYTMLGTGLIGLAGMIRRRINKG